MWTTEDIIRLSLVLIFAVIWPILAVINNWINNKKPNSISYSIWITINDKEIKVTDNIAPEVKDSLESILCDYVDELQKKRDENNNQTRNCSNSYP